jgi:hypothetical protein
LNDEDKKRCTQCKGVFPLEMFNRDAKGKKGRQAECKACHLKRDTQKAERSQLAYVQEEAEGRKREIMITRLALAHDGYVPCGKCNPLGRHPYYPGVTDPLVDCDACGGVGWISANGFTDNQWIKYLRESQIPVVYPEQMQEA